MEVIRLCTNGLKFLRQSCDNCKRNGCCCLECHAVRVCIFREAFCASWGNSGGSGVLARQEATRKGGM
jgi:hypothetical protein